MRNHQHIEVCGRESIGSRLGATLGRFLATLLLGAVLWVLIGILEIAATRQWVGPVFESNLEKGLDAGALFYTEVDIVPRKPSDAAPGGPYR